MVFDGVMILKLKLIMVSFQDKVRSLTGRVFKCELPPTKGVWSLQIITFKKPFAPFDHWIKVRVNAPPKLRVDLVNRIMQKVRAYYSLVIDVIEDQDGRLYVKIKGGDYFYV